MAVVCIDTNGKTILKGECLSSAIMIFKNRFDAGKQLAGKLGKYKNKKEALILAIPRGGLQVGNVLAKELHLQLDVIITKKIGYPGNPEYAIGAVSLTGASYDLDLLKTEGVSLKYVNEQIQEIRNVLKERYQQYGGKEKPISVKGKVVIITDDGVATGNTMLAAIDLLRKEKPKKIVVAVPVGHPDTVEKLRKAADEVVCLSIPPQLFAIGQFYEDFTQVDDTEAIQLLKEVHT